MATVCFVSNELAPYTWGGCGTLLRHLAEQLLGQETTVVFLLDVPAAAFTAFDTGSFVRPDLVSAYHVEALCADMPQERPESAWHLVTRARRCHHALLRLSSRVHLDTIEFTDYFGSALFALAAKIARGAYGESRIAVRMHSPISSIVSLEPHNPREEEMPLLRGMERQAVALAETVFCNTPRYFSSAGVEDFTLLSREPVTSPPPLAAPPARGPVRGDEANAILFFGRLFAFKGVDVFLDAALAFLRQNGATDAHFILAGHDSDRTPAGGGSYETYLRARIPQELQDRFVFPGTIGFADLSAMFASVRFAVFPSLLESFGYAAHEVHAAGIPLLVSDIPAFRDAFVDGQSALFFDGTAAGLAAKMEMLWSDRALCDALPRSSPEQPAPALDAYARPDARPSWIKAPDASCRPLRPLVVVLADGDGRERETVRAVLGQGGDASHIVVLHPDPCAREAFSFLGRLVVARGVDGGPFGQGEPLTAEALWLVRGGDLPLGEVLPLGLGVLARQPEIAFVAAFSEIEETAGTRLDCFPLDAGLELLPFLARPALSRAIMRTAPGIPLYDLFDPKLLTDGEFAYLLELVAAGGRGITIPECLLRRAAGDVACGASRALALLGDRHAPGKGDVGPALLRGVLWAHEALSDQAAALERRQAQCADWAGQLEGRLQQAVQETQEAWRRNATLEDDRQRLTAALEEGGRRERHLREQNEREQSALEAARAAHAAALEEGERRERQLRERNERDQNALEAARAAHAAAREEIAALAEKTAQCEVLRRERDALAAHGDGLAARLAAVENSLTWRCGIRMALSPPGRLLRRLLDALRA